MDRVRVLNNKIIEGHPIYQKYGTTLYDLSKKDYPNKNYFALHRNIKCISLDDYEASISGDNDKTMDAAIGTNFFSNGRNSSPQLLLVELRMGYKSTNNLSMSKMLSKLYHSKSLLGYTTTISNESYFIFDECIIHQAKSFFERKKKEVSGTIDMYAVSTTELTMTVVRVVRPVPSPIDMTSEIQGCNDLANKKKWRAILDKLEYWLKKYSDRLNAYDHYNAAPIKAGILKIYDIMEQHRSEFIDTDEELDFDIFKLNNSYLFDRFSV